jgi:hypothetical protein
MSTEKKLKHLEFIQNVITRMNTNSFMIKGWAVTLVAALFALSDKTHEHHLYLIAFIPVPLFWLLDGFFLATEKRYRNLYNKVADIVEDKIDFDMNPYHDIELIKNAGSRFSKNGFCNWWKIMTATVITWFWATFSITLILFYGVMLIVMFIVKTWLDV